MASSRRSRAIAVALALVPAAAAAQGAPAARPDAPLTLAGRLVVVHGADSGSVAGTWVVAHRVGTVRQGPVDSQRTDAAGRFRFRVAVPDTATVYVLSARHDGIGYFSEPYTAERRDGADAVVLAVFDTSSVGEPLRIGVRHVVVTAPDPDGSRRVLDIFQVQNTGTTTRVFADSTAPTWRSALPAGVTGHAAGESEVSASSIRFEGTEVLVTAPFPPGDKQVVVTYVLPARQRDLVVPVSLPTATLEVLAEDSSSQPGAGLERSDPLVLEGRQFQRFSAVGVSAGSSVTVQFGQVSDPLREYWWLPVGSAALLLAVGGAMAMRRRRAAAGTA